MSMSTAALITPIGKVCVTSDGRQLLSIRMGGDEEESAQADGLLIEALAQLRAWFEGRLHSFDLPLHPASTSRGAELRNAICDIPYAATASYGELARRIASGPRAVGQACRRNPFPIVVPCHRVIGAGQAIGYYSGGDGITTKRWLLDHEQRYAN